MSKLFRILAFAVAGFAIGAALGAALVGGFSPNRHDKSLEMAMTAFFAAGPVGAVVGAIVGLVWRRRGSPPV